MSFFLRTSYHLKRVLGNIAVRLLRIAIRLAKCLGIKHIAALLPARLLLYLRDILYAMGLEKGSYVALGVLSNMEISHAMSLKKGGYVARLINSLLQQKIPLPEEKQSALAQHADRYSLKILVETGTHEGNTIEYLKRNFDYIYSVELSEYFYQRAKERFKQEKHIELIHGDSGEVLKDICNKLDRPALFYLDSHYSFDAVVVRGNKITPIMEELTHIFNAKDLGHVIIIDDLRAFGYSPDFPSIKELKDFVIKHRPNSKIRLKNDSIQILPSR